MWLDLRAAAVPHKHQLPEASSLLFSQAEQTWKARMKNEYASHLVFEQLGTQLDSAGFDEDWVAECRRFAVEERAHGVFCGAVVEALGGAACAELRTPESFPLHPDTSLRAAALRNVIHICCMSETVAVALIGAERLEMGEESPLHALLTRIYADEVGHARFGWRLLNAVAPELRPEERVDVERYLPVAFEHLVEHELNHLPPVPAPEGGALLGLCSGLEARELLYESIRTVIRPGLRRFFDC